MMTKKKAYLTLLCSMPTKQIEDSLQSPTDYMTPVHIVLHKIALRRRGHWYDDGIAEDTGAHGWRSEQAWTTARSMYTRKTAS